MRRTSSAWLTPWLGIGAGLAAGAAVAQDLPWAGRWGGPGCTAEVTVGSAEVRRDGAGCPVTAIVPLGATGAVALRLACDGVVADLVLLYDRAGDRLWLWDGPERRAPRPMWRCDGGPE